MTATVFGEKKTSSGWLRLEWNFFLLFLLVVACIFLCVGSAPEGGRIQRVHYVPDVESVFSRHRFDIAVVAHHPIMEILENRDGCGMTLFHVTDDHVAADQLIESKHRNDG